MCFKNQYIKDARCHINVSIFPVDILSLMYIPMITLEWINLLHG